MKENSPSGIGGVSPWTAGFRIARFEAGEALRGTALWVGLAVLTLFLLGVKGLFSGDFVLNGQALSHQVRLVYFLGVGYSMLTFLTTLYGLAVCVERTGTGYLRGNDLLLLARPVSRSVFYFGKMGGALAAVFFFSVISVSLFWVALYWYSGVNLYGLLWLVAPQCLGLAALVSLFFWLRQFLGNVTVFFICIALLPFSYASNLWYYYGATLRESLQTAWSWPQFLPQFGGLHAFALGLVQDFYFRPATWVAVANIGLWILLALVAGALRFRRRLL